MLTEIGNLAKSVSKMEKDGFIAKKTSDALQHEVWTLREVWQRMKGIEETGCTPKARLFDSRLPSLGKAAEILLTLRTALPLEANTLSAEEAITACIHEVAEQLQAAMVTSK